MIQEISINDVASYKTPVTVTGLKRINLFYGLNGTGKSTLSQYLKECHTPSERFLKSSVKFVHDDSAFEVLVYNQSFVQENFLETEKQKGIFTLDKANAAALTAIAAARDIIKTLEEEKKPLLEEWARLKKEQEDIKSSISDVIWEAKKTHEKSVLKECMTGFLSPKASFAEKVISSEAADVEKNKVESALSQIQSELSELNSANLQKRSPYALLGNDLSETENNSIFKEKIVGSTDSYLSELIAKLNHADWVTQGINNYIDKTDECPFCKRALDEKLKNNIKKYVDRTYQSKIESLEKLKKHYNEQREILETKLRMYKSDTSLSKDKNLNAYIERLQSALNINASLIDKKSKEASLPVDLGQTLITIQEIDKIITEENNAIKLFNSKIDNRDQAISTIKKQFWALLKKQYEGEIEVFEKAFSSSVDASAKIKELGDAINKKIAAQRDVISEHQKHTKNVDVAVNRINSRLKSFGLEGFEVKKTESAEGGEENILYKIERDSPSGERTEFNTLSEGEKTLITFLYFVEFCLGTEDSEKDAHASTRVVVIDDPISSLSFNLVFDIATLIKNVFFSKQAAYKQVFVLTHHLYFLHELFGKVQTDLPKDYSLFRIAKSGKTQITATTRAEIKNNYECYWQIVKDVKNNRASSVILPNAMRNILEHYFSFIHGEDSLAEAIGRLSHEKDDSAFWAFQRFVARGSHLDSINLTDMGEIDVTKFLSYFKEIFAQTDYLNHYNSMMGNDADTEAAHLRQVA